MGQREETVWWFWCESVFTYWSQALYSLVLVESLYIGLITASSFLQMCHVWAERSENQQTTDQPCKIDVGSKTSLSKLCIRGQDQWRGMVFLGAREGKGRRKAETRCVRWWGYSFPSWEYTSEEIIHILEDRRDSRRNSCHLQTMALWDKLVILENLARHLTLQITAHTVEISVSLFQRY